MHFFIIIIIIIRKRFQGREKTKIRQHPSGGPSLSLSEIRVVASNLYGSHHTHTLGTLVFITLELILSMCVCVCRYILCAQSTKVHTKRRRKRKIRKIPKEKKNMYVCALGTEMSHLHHSGDPRKVKVPVSFFLLLPFPKNIQRVYTIPKRGHARAVLLLDTEKIKKKNEQRG